MNLKVISKALFVLNLLLLTVAATYAQQAPGSGSISGRLIDGTNNQALDYATVALFRKADKQPVKSAQTDPQGNFNLTGVPEGVYFLRITFVSYLTYTKDSLAITPNRSAIQLGTIRMRPSRGVLKEVTVSAQRSQMQVGIDKKSFNVEQSLVSQGGSATDLLSNVPSVQVDVDGNISLRGSSNVRVLINGKPSALTGGNLADILQSIPASSIETIEVITNPSAKYDAEGQSGIINIVLKKNVALGFNGSASASVGNNKTYNGTLNLAYQAKKVNIYTNYSYRRADRIGNGFTNKTTHFAGDSVNSQQQVNDQKFTFNVHNIRSGIDFNLSPKTTLSLSDNINIRQRDRYLNGTTNIFNNAGGMMQSTNQNTVSNGKGTNVDLNLDFDHKFKKPQEELTANFGYSTDNEDNMDNLNNSYQFFLPSASDRNYLQHNRTFVHQYNINIQADYTLPIDKNSKLEAGYRTVINQNDNNYLVDTLNSNGVFVPDYILRNHFLYKENINAAYANYQHQFGNFGVQLGLRLEDSHIRTTLTDSSQNNYNAQQNYKQDYLRLYPSVFLTQKLSENQTLQLSYSRRVSRPRDRQISPFLDISDPYNYNQGNPYLLPEDTHAFEFSYVNYWKALTLTSSIYYRLTNDNIQQIRSLYSPTVTLNTFANVNSASNAGYELIAKVSPGSFLDLTGNVNVYYRHIEGSPELNLQTTSGWAYNGNLTANIKPFKKLGIQLRGDYQGKQVIPQGYMKAMYGLDGGIRYDITKTLNLSINSRDIFNTRKFTGVSTINGTNGSSVLYADQIAQRRFSSRTVIATLSYRFGSSGNQNRQRNKNREQQQDQDMQDESVPSNPQPSTPQPSTPNTPRPQMQRSN